MKSILKLVRRTWSFFFGLVALDLIVTAFLGFIRSDLFWYQILWGGMIAENLGIETGSGIAYTPSTAGWVVLGLTLLVNLSILYLLALFLSKKVFKKRANKPQRPRFEMPDQG